MAKFKAGDMIISHSEENGYSVLMVNRVIDGIWYSLDNGNGFIDARDRITTVDAEYELCD